MAAGLDEVVFHPAGLDAELRGAVTDLQAGRWMSTRELLARTGGDWPLRTARSQVLAASSDVLEHWAGEDAGSVDLAVLRARVAVLRALSAAREGRPQARAMHETAREACWHAARIAPADPVPWVALLELAVLDPGQVLQEHGGQPPDAMLPAGPWWLLSQLQRRDPDSREGHHRMLRWWLHHGRPGFGQGVRELADGPRPERLAPAAPAAVPARGAIPHRPEGGCAAGQPVDAGAVHPGHRAGVGALVPWPGERGTVGVGPEPEVQGH